jgi:hypothetical protein
MPKEPCIQSQEVTGTCDVCQGPVTLMHLPIRPLGFYCEKHCPVCSTRCHATIEVAHREYGAHETKSTYVSYYDSRVVRVVAAKLRVKNV